MSFEVPVWLRKLLENCNPRIRSVHEELTHPAAIGSRHSQMVNVVIPLLEIGLSTSAVFHQFRGMYASDVPDEEIEAIIEWGKQRQGEAPSTPFAGRRSKARRGVLTSLDADGNAIAWLNGFEVDEASLEEASPVSLGENWQSDSILLLTHLYQPDELVTINTSYRVEKKESGIEKGTLRGPGRTQTVGAWIKEIHAQGTPQDRAGAWIRLNPVRTICGNTETGAHTDADVAAYRYLLVDSDKLSFDVALSVFAKLPLPVACIISSGGRGPHAWLRLDAQTDQEFREKAAWIFGQLAPLGIDPGNGNPSRYGRLPGARRIIGAQSPHAANGDALGVQRLYYLAPEPNLKGIFS